MSNKMDRQGVRTASQLEQKYQFGKSFAEVMGIAKDAQEAADKAASNVSKLDENLTAEEIFNRLTNNGTSQGLYRDENGELYINAEFIKSLDQLFAKDINMSGKFTYTAEVFIEPSATEVETIENHLKGLPPIYTDRIPLYDFDSDGEITTRDLANARIASLGLGSLANWSGAKKSKVTMTIDFSNPQKLIQITGTDMWGKDIDSYIGINFTSIRNPKTEQKLNELSENCIVESGTEYNEVGAWHYKKFADGTIHCYCTTDSMAVAFGDGNWYNVGNYANVSLILPALFVETPYCANVNPLCGEGLFFVSINGITQTSINIYCAELGVTNILQRPMKFTVSVYGKWK